jgi:hypothetical protein
MILAQRVIPAWVIEFLINLNGSFEIYLSAGVSLGKLIRCSSSISVDRERTQLDDDKSSTTSLDSFVTEILLDPSISLASFLS